MRALVLSDLGACADIVAGMEARGWQVTTAVVLEVSHDGPDALAQYDLIWIPAQTNYEGLRTLAAAGGPLELYTIQGGVVVIWGLSPDTIWLDVAPGGMDAEPLPDGQAGPVVITAADHPLISGNGTGGVPLTELDLDPFLVGGSACVLNTPQASHAVGEAVVIAQNTLAPVVVDYSLGQGHVVICAILDELNTCCDNVLLYAQSLMQ